MGSSNTDKRSRQMLKKKLIKWGMDEEEIKKCIEQVRQRQQDKREGRLPLDAPLCTRAEYRRLLKKNLSPDGRNGAAIFKLGHDYQPPSDKGYHPTKVDSVLTGVGRATGATAKSIKSRKAMNKYDYDRKVGNDALDSE